MSNIKLSVAFNDYHFTQTIFIKFDKKVELAGVTTVITSAFAYISLT